MQQKMFSVYDVKAGNYLPPFMSRNNDTAVREFATAGMDPSHMFHMHAADYSLFFIGEFNTETAAVEQNKPEQIYTGLQVQATVSAAQ